VHGTSKTSSALGMGLVLDYCDGRPLDGRSKAAAVPWGMSALVNQSRPPTGKSKRVVAHDKNLLVVRSCTIRRAAPELHAAWRDTAVLARIAGPRCRITDVDAVETHWMIDGPPGARHLEWRAIVITDVPGEVVAWRSRDDGGLANAGSVRFTPAPGDEGTEVKVELRYEPPRARALAWFAKLVRKDPGSFVAEALRRFKALMEAGEIPTTAGQPVGRPTADRKEETR
jgi:uncharacterized membrane protein